MRGLAVKSAMFAALVAAGVYAIDVPALTAQGPARQAAVAKPKPKPKAVSPAPEPLLLNAATPASVETSFVVKRVLNIPGPLKHGAWVWDDEGVPQGPLLITVDLAAQTISVFRDGYEIGVAVILYGADDKPTPLGTFPITQKKRHHVSNIYGAPMPYMMRLTNDGVAIHASEVDWGNATHGCIGVPSEFAARLFAEAKLGDHVIITNGKMMDLGAATPAT